LATGSVKEVGEVGWFADEEFGGTCHPGLSPLAGKAGPRREKLPGPGRDQQTGQPVPAEYRCAKEHGCTEIRHIDLLPAGPGNPAPYRQVCAVRYDEQDHECERSQRGGEDDGPGQGRVTR